MRSAPHTLDLACAEPVPPHRKFELDVRTATNPQNSETLGARASVSPPKATQTSPAGPALNQAREALHRVFGKGRKDAHPREVKDLWRELGALLGSAQDWDWVSIVAWSTLCYF